MTYFFSDENANRIAERQWAMPAVPEVGDPGVLQGSGTAVVKALPASIGQMFQTTMDWGPVRGINALASFADDWIGTGFAENYDKQRELLRQSIRSLKPDPATTGAAGQIIYGAGTVIPQAALGFAAAGPFGAAAVAGTAQANTEYANQTEQGADGGTAAVVAGITGLTTAVGVAIPGTMGTGLGPQLAYSIGTNVGLGMAQRGATGAVLEAGGYKTMADNYKVLDGMAIATDAVLGAAVPFVGRLGKRGEAPAATRPEPRPSEIDAAHYANEVVHLERDSAPGLHKTPESANAHIEATLRTQEQLFADNRPVESLDVADLVARTDMEADPRHIQDVLDLAEQVRSAAPAELRREVERITKLEEQPPAPVAVKAPQLTTAQIEAAGGFEMPFDRVAAEGDGAQSPWLLADGRIVGTGQDHMAFASNAMPGGVLGYSDFMNATGAARVAMFRDPENGYVATVHLAEGQTLTNAQLSALKDIQSKNGEPITVLYGEADGLVNPEYRQMDLAGLEKLTEENRARAAQPLQPADPKFYDDNAALAQAGDVPAAEIASARQAIANMPDMTIVDENGNSVSAKEYLDGIDREIDNAKKDAKLHDVAVACFMLHGDL